MAGIRISGLGKSYGENFVALSGLDLDVEDGAFVTLLGPSGCGKTTTLRLVAGYMEPTSGTIHAGDRLLSSPEGVVPPERRGMGMVFQNYAVWPHKTVAENVGFGLRMRRVAGAALTRQVDAALEQVGLAGLGRRFPAELSGGQQQRVALARSLVVEPGILLFDEPLSNLDAKLRERMRGELRQLQRRTGITFIYVTHDQAEALALSDRIAVMSKGRLQQYGTPHDVYRRPTNKVVADFMGLVNFLPGRVSSAGSVTLDGGETLPLAIPSGLCAGDAVDVAVRPEDIRLGPRGDGPASLVGEVAEQVFLGNMTEHWLLLPGGGKLRVQTHPLDGHAPGSIVAATIDPDQCNVFARA